MIFGLNLVWVLALTANSRIVNSREQYGLALLSQSIIGAGFFFMTKRIQRADTKLEAVAYVLGGCCGCILAIFATRSLPH